ncbi:hypothetical protein [Paeniglutamicibacter psychrophenolicus]|uniref:hypothetical protein n=1 Tax=Paeniglutamicibacter psychrophenolicus TaxID=257454 RepID=UPI00278655D8|nr:hypothetical protein [Paeniglutamicibacter psychrophenolicus]MDQ0093742.1 hypothetical protein [Paeniglutamicibacter psychrophenolicus]
MRSTSSFMATALLVGAALLLSGCAGSTGGGTTPFESATPPAPSTSPGTGPPTTDLQVSIRADGSVESAHYRLLCRGAGPLPESRHPDAARACALVAKEPNLLAGPRRGANVACTMQYGGPAVAVVSGTMDGRAVNRRFDLRDGCGIADWHAALALLVDQPALQ